MSKSRDCGRTGTRAGSKKAAEALNLKKGKPSVAAGKKGASTLWKIKKTRKEHKKNVQAYGTVL